MPMEFTSKWRQYKKIIDQINLAKVRGSILSSVSTEEKLKQLRNELFSDYEGFINANNMVNPIVLKTTIARWFAQNCRMKSQQEVENWVHSLNINSEMTVREIADDKIGASMCKLCFLGGTPYCPQVKGDETGCATQLVSEIVKSSDRYTHIPNTEENFNTFLNGSTQYLKKEVRAQEENDSPIEVIMYEALKPVAQRNGYRLEREHPVYDDGRTEIRYSLDIVFIDKNNNVVLDVECDGLSFHQGYRSMAEDRARDRWLLIRGIPTMRFTSREIFNDLDNCVLQVEYALKALYRNKR